MILTQETLKKCQIKLPRACIGEVVLYLNEIKESDQIRSPETY